MLTTDWPGKVSRPSSVSISCPPAFDAFDDQRLQVGARGVESGGSGRQALTR